MHEGTAVAIRQSFAFEALEKRMDGGELEFSRYGDRRDIEPRKTIMAPAVGCNDLFGQNSCVARKNAPDSRPL